MSVTEKSPAEMLTLREINERGMALRERFWRAGRPQYSTWFADRDPETFGSDEAKATLRNLFNGKGTKALAALLIKCEALANEAGIPQSQAA